MENLTVYEAAIGPQQIILIIVLLVLLFRAKKIPELMKGVGKGIKEFKDASNEESDDSKKSK